MKYSFKWWWPAHVELDVTWLWSFGRYSWPPYSSRPLLQALHLGPLTITRRPR